MLVLTPTAIEVVNVLTTGPGFPDSAGLRIATTAEGATENQLAVQVVVGPAESDQVLAEHGATVYLEPEAAAYLEDKVLNAEVDARGEAHFTVFAQSQDSP